MSDGGNDKTQAYASAELGSELRGGASDAVRSFAGLINDPQTIKLLNYYDGILERPIEETELGKTIISNAATATIDDAVRGGNVSQMKTAMGLTNQEQDGQDLYGLVAQQLSHEGAIGLIFGAPGSGKTATKIDCAIAWQIRTGGTLIGNFEWERFERVVKSDREMFEAMAHIEGPVLCLLDEIAQELSGFGEGNKAAEGFSDSLLLIRKREEQHGPYPKKGCVLMTAHTRTKTARPIRLITSFAIEKPSRADPGRARLLESEADSDTWEQIGGDFKGLTDTREQYDEYDASSFDVLEADEDEDAEAVDADTVKKDEHIATAIRACERGMTYDEVAELVPWSSDWVGKVYRQWRDENRHRQLVAKPELQEAD